MGRTTKMALVKDEIMPFDRQPNESARAFLYFTFYRDLGATRTLKATVEEIVKKIGVRISSAALSELKARWEWDRRILAWDLYNDRLTQQEHLKAVAKARKEQAATAAMYRGAAAMVTSSIVAELARRIDEQKKSGYNFLADLSPEAMSLVLKQATAVMVGANSEERLALGIANEVVETRNSSTQVNVNLDATNTQGQGIEDLKAKLARLGFAPEARPELPSPDETADIVEGDFSDESVPEETPPPSSERIDAAIPPEPPEE